MKSTLTSADVQSILADNVMVANRLDETIDETVVAPQILTGRSETNGAMAIRQQEAAPDAEPVAPGAEYPLATLGSSYRIIPMGKSGIEVELTDEDIARDPEGTLRRSMLTLASSVGRQMDRAAVEVLTGDAGVQEFTGNKPTNAEEWIETLLAAQAQAVEKDTRLNPALVLTNYGDYATIVAKLRGARIIDAGADASDLGLQFLRIQGLKGVWMADPRFLGGLAHWALPSPEYAKGPMGVETMSDRTRRDAWRVRARYAGAAYLEAPQAAIKLTLS